MGLNLKCDGFFLSFFCFFFDYCVRSKSRRADKLRSGDSIRSFGGKTSRMPTAADRRQPIANCRRQQKKSAAYARRETSSLRLLFWRCRACKSASLELHKSHEKRLDCPREKAVNETSVFHRRSPNLFFRRFFPCRQTRAT